MLVIIAINFPGDNKFHHIAIMNFHDNIFVYKGDQLQTEFIARKSLHASRYTQVATRKSLHASRYFIARKSLNHGPNRFWPTRPHL